MNIWRLILLLQSVLFVATPAQTQQLDFTGVWDLIQARSRDDKPLQLQNMFFSAIEIRKQADGLSCRYRSSERIVSCTLEQGFDANEVSVKLANETLILKVNGDSLRGVGWLGQRYSLARRGTPEATRMTNAATTFSGIADAVRVVTGSWSARSSFTSEWGTTTSCQSTTEYRVSWDITPTASDTVQIRASYDYDETRSRGGYDECHLSNGRYVQKWQEEYLGSFRINLSSDGRAASVTGFFINEGCTGDCRGVNAKSHDKSFLIAPNQTQFTSKLHQKEVSFNKQ